MPNLILHHYPLSPFSEKIRAMLGYSGLHWQSALTREMPPRPVLAALAGGYRKVPVAQVGADIFCDSKSIAAEIAALSGKPALALEHCSAEAQDDAAHADLHLFMACVIAGGTRTLGRKVLKTMSVMEIVRFIWDRINIGRKATIKSPAARNPRKYILDHLAGLEARLHQDFLFGREPNHADYSTYHCLWFVRDLGESPLVQGFPKILSWMDRMKAFGHGPHEQITAEQALDIARQATPRPIAAEHRTDPLIGKSVQVAPSDYAQVPTPGVLAGVTPTQWILAREDAQAGTLHVHFPRAGFRLTPL